MATVRHTLKYSLDIFSSSLKNFAVYYCTATQKFQVLINGRTHFSSYSQRNFSLQHIWVRARSKIKTKRKTASFRAREWNVYCLYWMWFGAGYGRQPTNPLLNIIKIHCVMINAFVPQFVPGVLRCSSKYLIELKNERISMHVRLWYCAQRREERTERSAESWI